MTLMGFETGPTRHTTPRTLHGWIHDLALLSALFFLWRRLRRDPLWQNHARYTLVTGILAVLLLFLPGVAYFLFLAAVLLWIELTALRLRVVPEASKANSPHT